MQLWEEKALIREEGRSEGIKEGRVLSGEGRQMKSIRNSSKDRIEACTDGVDNLTIEVT